MPTRRRPASSVAHLDRPPLVLTSRAALRPVQPGIYHWCRGCGEMLRYHRAARPLQVVCNVYAGDVWDHIDVFHPGCYETAGEPYGRPDDARDTWPER